jgi:regulator of cell morphogenesis and NO signaling
VSHGASLAAIRYLGPIKAVSYVSNVLDRVFGADGPVTNVVAKPLKSLRLFLSSSNVVVEDIDMQTAVKQVRDMAIEQPSSVRVFERFGIDYCCGGRKPLEQVCAEQKISLPQLLEGLAEAEHHSPQPTEPWTTRPLAELVDHIVSECHGPTRMELGRLTALAHKVTSRHGANHPELAQIQKLVQQIVDEMTPHMDKEERVLFPYIASLEVAAHNGCAKPYAFFGDVANPIAAMMADHDLVGAALASIRSLSNNFELPEGACPTYSALYTTLAEFETLTHRHVHLENNVLFPRAIELAGRE